MSAKLLAPLFAVTSAAALCAVAACSSSKRGPVPEPVPTKPSLTIFALAETRGQIGPCGCTTDPLGDLSRTAALVAEARQQGPVLVVDAGGLLYSQPHIAAAMETQEELKADLLVSSYRDALGVAAVGLGASDLARGAEEVRPPRQAVNLAPAVAPTGPAGKIPTEAPKVIAVGDTNVGVFGVLAAGAVEGLQITDPIAAGKGAVAELRKQGAKLVVGLIQAPSQAAAGELARAIGGIDLVIAGLGMSAPEPDRVSPQAEELTGGGFLVIPGNRGQVVSRIEVTMRKGAGLADAGGRAAAAVRIAQIAKRIPSVEADLVRFASDASADPAFVAAKKNELAQLQQERLDLDRSPLRAPAHGSFFTLEQVRIGKKLACHLDVQAQTAAYFHAAGEANVKAAQSQPVMPVPPRTATYVGSAKCVECHDTQVEFWKKSRHAGAWQTLVERGQQFDLECISCHVTGWNKAGGATLTKNEDLRDVQCEVCHGPASIHVAKEGDEEPKTLVGAPEPALCAKQCHTKEHSDTFAYEAYLRDIVGPGHGEDRRKALGNGPTGRELRTAGLERAGKTLGAGCTK
jgi:2',3'-cyclic-nucleotide 2'-phosphodiesterase (5'-nucleotidase family)